MNALARKFNIEELEDEPSASDGVTKECPDCDPDGYVRANPKTCEGCKGTGRVGLSAAGIAAEIRASKKEKPRVFNGGKSGKGREKAKPVSDDDDLYLEY